MFLQSESVSNVKVEDYLKRLEVFTETKKMVKSTSVNEVSKCVLFYKTTHKDTTESACSLKIKWETSSQQSTASNSSSKISSMK